MNTLTLLVSTVQLRPYVFLFLAAFLICARNLIGWQRAGLFFGITSITAFVCELSSTRTGFPFGWYHYTGSTVGRELYLSNVPVMDPLSFSFLLYAGYCLALSFLLPTPVKTSSNATPSRRVGILPLTFSRSVRSGWPALLLSTLFFVFIDIVIDPVALRGDQWFLGKVYYYPDPGLHFGVPAANYLGWAFVGVVALSFYCLLDRRLPEPEGRTHESVTDKILMGCGLYYAVLFFNLTIAFWIDEPLIGMTGILMYFPLTALLLLRLRGHLPTATASLMPGSGEIEQRDSFVRSKKNATGFGLAHGLGRIQGIYVIANRSRIPQHRNRELQEKTKR